MITSIAEGKGQGLRPFDPVRDLGRVADLLEIAFREELGPESRGFLQEMRAAGYLGPLLWALAPLAGFAGFVWEDGGDIVGNLTLSHWGEGGYLISNVAVHPHFRRCGIARRLMETALEWAEARGAPWMILEVRRENFPAKRLYETLGFVSLDATSEMRRDSSAPPESMGSKEGVFELSLRRDWPQLWQLYQSSLTPVARRILGKEKEDFRPGLGSLLPGWLGRGFLGRELRQWGVEREGELAASIRISASRIGLPHKIEVMIHPRWRGQVEKPLLAEALQFLGKFPKQYVVAKIHHSHPDTETAFEELAFRQVQVLERMSLELRNKKGG